MDAVKKLINIYENLDGLSNTKVRELLKEVIEGLKANKSKEDNFDVYKKAIETYGINAQLDMVIEEMSELTKEICKRKRGKDNKEAIAEEIADVFIMIKQLQMMVGIHDSEVAAVKHDKLSRLAERLKEHANS